MLIVNDKISKTFIVAKKRVDTTRKSSRLKSDQQVELTDTFIANQVWTKRGLSVRNSQ
jgi:ElaB/YqjD/DUF883 family membrane-anchored ribosome-binding protein